MMMTWERITDDLLRFRDSCNVYALRAPEGIVLVNAGSGRWLAHQDELPAQPVALLCTHYFRDHSAGAVAAARRGIPVHVPEGEEALFADPEQHFRQRETYIIYDNLWDLYAPIEAVPVAATLRDYETVALAGTSVEVIPLPGVTMTQIGIGVTLADGRSAVFCGEAIHSPGKLARIAPLQYNYNDLNGAVQCHFAAGELRKRKPDLLFPSLGEPILTDTDAALGELQDNLRRLAEPRPGLVGNMAVSETEPLERVTDHVWLDPHSVANTWYLISDSGKALAIDYGYHRTTCAAWQGYPKPERRRALLHGLTGLKQRFGIDRIDVVLVSHFHDDHVCGIPVLQRLQGTQCWAAENFADLLRHPEAHCFPCDWPVAARIDRELPLGTPFMWEEYTFVLHPMNGHTRFAALIGFEADGKRFAHTGDQYFFNGDFSGGKGFAGVGRMQNHVFRNGALLDGYEISGKWMRDWRPDIVLQGHQPAMFTDDAFFAHIAEWSTDYADLARRILPLGEEEAHFNLDAWGGWVRPYRTCHPDVRPITVTVTVRNPLPCPAMLEVRLVGIEGWQGETASLPADARAEVSTELTIVPTGRCRRQPFAVELTVEGRCYGQVAEALATLGHSRF
ncbi:MAG: MBL fold metallo-hydrolase [Capsulimonadales bacterium]|nr:MBL fold metallo-hydrolase [Capsulimonadales bacterium]